MSLTLTAWLCGGDGDSGACRRGCRQRGQPGHRRPPRPPPPGCSAAPGHTGDMGDVIASGGCGFSWAWGRRGQRPSCAQSAGGRGGGQRCRPRTSGKTIVSRRPPPLQPGRDSGQGASWAQRPGGGRPGGRKQQGQTHRCGRRRRDQGAAAWGSETGRPGPGPAVGARLALTSVGAPPSTPANSRIHSS